MTMRGRITYPSGLAIAAMRTKKELIIEIT
jgi:hypothetical protein